MKKLICVLLTLSFTFLLSSSLNELIAQVKDGDYITVKINGVNTYDVTINGKSYKCFRHGKLNSFVYYIDPAKGWTFPEPNDKITYTKFEMPKVGAEIYGISGGKAMKGIISAIGVGGYDSHSLFIKAKVKDSQGKIKEVQFNNYATQIEIGQLNWPLGNPQIADADLRKIESEIYATVIKARANPAAFAGSLMTYGNTDPVVKEAMAFLKNIGSSNHQFKLLHRKNGMDIAARAHAAEYAADSSVGHKGASSDCSNKRDYLACRLGRHGTVKGHTGENIYSGGGASTFPGSGAVMALILDHGVQSRGHRAAFFDTYGDNLTANKENVQKYVCNYEAIGVGCAYDKKSGNIACVIDFADGYQ